MRILRLLPAVLLLAVSCLALGGPLEARGAGPSGSGPLAARIDRRLRAAGLAAGRYGIAVLTRGTAPRVVYARDADRALVPASAAKILTSAAALDMLGPGHVFRTRLTARGDQRSDGTLEGDLVLHGSGDPNISGRLHDGEPMAVLAELARAVHQQGIRRVTGALVLDEGPFDREFVHPDWSAADRTRWYGAPVGGLAFNDNCIDVHLRGARPGQPAVLRLPATAGPWPVRNEVTSVAGSRTAAGARWNEDASALRLHGRVATGKETRFSVPVPDPAAFLGGALLQALRRRDVTVDGGQRRPRDADDRRPGRRLLFEHANGIAKTLEVLNRNSQNVYAATLFKLSGAAHSGRGTWQGGHDAVKAMLERRGIPDGGSTVARDGSGLSARNRVSAGVLAQVLVSFDGDILRGPLLLDSLPVSGRSGTLRRRLRGTDVIGRVHAKTGTLNDTRARALAGYLDARPGGTGYVFAILLNGGGASHAVIDDIVRELAR